MTLPPSASGVQADSPLHRPAPHDSAQAHVTGTAVYTDDLCPPGTLHGVLVPSPVAHGRLLAVHTSQARAMPGVVAVYTADDVPGPLEVGPVVHDEPVLARGTLHYKGQAVAIVFAQTREQARLAADEITLELEELPPVLTIDQAIERGDYLVDEHVIARGQADEVLARIEDEGGVVVQGHVRTGGQDHFYLETQATLALPQEGGALRLISSTQHPTEIQRMAARVLGIAQHLVSCEVPRMGGGFGGKESQATVYACLAALGAHQTGRPCKVWLPRHQDMAFTGGRHPFMSRYRAAFDSQGRWQAFAVDIYSDGGWTTDLSGPVLDRALYHLDNAYYIPHLRFVGRACRTNKPSNTAFRGFGGPQGIVVCEDAIKRAARALGMEPETVRRASYYGADRGLGVETDRAPYGQQVPAPRILAMHDTLATEAQLEERRAEIAAFNQANRWLKRGIALQPLKFGISFTLALLNQAGALVLVYADGSVQLNHGGTEMGQGLHTKMRAVAADVLGVQADGVRIMRTSTEKVPNTSATAASSGSDLNGMAVRRACETIRGRMAPVAAHMLGCAESDLHWEGGLVSSAGKQAVPFADVANQCWVDQVSLSATGYYATPGIQYDHAKGQGTPFFYFAYGVAIIEVELLGLTGEHRVRRLDILHDVGDSLVPPIDRGQVLGAFTQGMGWLTGEEVLVGQDGGVKTVGPSTYKVPAVGDIPLDLRLRLLPNATQEGTIGGSKAVGEPPFMLAIGVVEALEDAISAFGEGPLELELPATAEQLLRAVEKRRGGFGVE